MKQENNDTGIRRSILARMILIPLIPFVLVILIGYVHSKVSIENRTIRSMCRIVEDHSRMIDTFLRERRANLEFVVNTHSFESLRLDRNLEFVYRNLRTLSSAFADLGIFDEDGLHIAYHGPYPLEGRMYKDEPWFKEVMETGVHISDVFSGFRDSPHFIIAVKKEDDDRAWVLRATIDTQIFTTMVGRIRIGETGEAYIINKEGLLQTQPRTAKDLTGPDFADAHYLTPHDGVKTWGSDRKFAGFFGRPDSTYQRHLVATTWLTEKPWLLVARQEKHDAFSGLRVAMYVIGSIALAGSTAIVLTAFRQTEHLLQRIREISGEKAALENQLIHATKLAELGQMAAGFAHEINNPLQVMRSEHALMCFIISEIKKNQKWKTEQAMAELEESVGQIMVQIERCAGITRAILDFGRHAEAQVEDIDVRDFIPQAIETISNKAAVNGISVRQQISADTPPVRADKVQLQQVLLNVFNNAIDAIVERYGSNGGKLTVSAKPEGDQWVSIAVQDNGKGINRDNLDRIFTPFFSTKPPGKGAGLGLSVCYGIVEGLGGKMSVSSVKWQGTTFTIQLPAGKLKQTKADLKETIDE